MAHFTPIDMNNWARRPYFEHYYNLVKCTYSATVQIDITSLLEVSKKSEVKLYPCMIYIISRAVNQLEELRTNFDGEGKLGVWDVLFPSYTIFRDEDKSFSNLWTSYSENFAKFHNDYLEDNKTYKGSKDFFPKGPDPLNSFPISCIPWLDFTAFNLNIYDDARYLSPIFTIGKYKKENGKTSLPVACQLHHGLADGYHAGLLFTAIKDLAASFTV